MEAEKQHENNSDDEMSDDPFASSGDESSGEEIQQVLLRKSTPKPVNIKPASKQSIIDWVASAWYKIGQKPDMVMKSFIVTGIAQALDGSEDDSVRNAHVENDIAAGLNPDVGESDSDDLLVSSSDMSSDNEVNDE